MVQATFSLNEIQALLNVKAFADTDLGAALRRLHELARKPVRKRIALL